MTSGVTELKRKGVDPVSELGTGLSDGSGMDSSRGTKPIRMMTIEVPNDEEGEGWMSSTGRVDVTGQCLEAGEGISIASAGMGLEVYSGEEERTAAVGLDDCTEDSGGRRRVGGETGVDGVRVSREELNRTVGVVEEGDTSRHRRSGQSPMG
jgi:hypothetical protein